MIQAFTKLCKLVYPWERHLVYLIKDPAVVCDSRSVVRSTEQGRCGLVDCNAADFYINPAWSGRADHDACPATIQCTRISISCSCITPMSCQGMRSVILPISLSVRFTKRAVAYMFWCFHMSLLIPRQNKLG